LRIAAGCHLNRPIDHLISDAGMIIRELQTGYGQGRGRSAICIVVGRYVWLEMCSMAPSGYTSVALVTKSFLDPCRVLFHLTCAVAGPRPEEPSQTVATAARHDVQVQVWDRLADNVVNRNEGALRSEGIDQRTSDVLRTGQKWFHQALRQVEQRVDMLQWGDQHMTFEDRPVIKKRDHVVGTEDDRRVDITAADLAKHIVAHRHETSAIRV